MKEELFSMTLIDPDLRNVVQIHRHCVQNHRYYVQDLQQLYLIHLFLQDHLPHLTDMTDDHIQRYIYYNAGLQVTCFNWFIFLSK